MLKVMILHAMEKVFPDAAPEGNAAVKSVSGFRNESIYFQIAVCNEAQENLSLKLCPEGEIALHADVRIVRSVPATYITRPGADDNYLRKTPGLYPDLLQHAPYITLNNGIWKAFFIEITPDGMPAGTYALDFTLRNIQDDACLYRGSIDIRILDAFLPPQKLIRTNWFHADCLAEYYHTPVFSEKHWTIIENFMRTAAKRGINMILTPIFTPPLDTAVGTERLAVQLVDVEKTAAGYNFGFEKLERWVAAAGRAGMEYFEMSHLFTQWGAKHPPEIVIRVNGRRRTIDHWNIPADGPEYREFLRQFLPELMKELHKLGIQDKTSFHISDEPNGDSLSQYLAARDMVAPYVEDCPIMDALSDIAFYHSGAVKKPVPAINHIQPFLDENVPGLWTYYCVGQYRDVPNLFIAMPGPRTRILGVLLYKYNIEGFLQWGYNFYHSQLSHSIINPYLITDADGTLPAGDPFQVYPGADGKPEESLRLLLCHMAMQDLRALQLLESLAGRDLVLQILSDCADGSLTLTDYPRDARFFAALRSRIDGEILRLTGK